VRRLAAVAATLLALAGCAGGDETLAEHVCNRVADGDSDMQIARDLAGDVDGDTSPANVRSWLLNTVVPAKQTC
jgi:hypothetical protein